jgi:sulfur-carrier protein
LTSGQYVGINVIEVKPEVRMPTVFFTRALQRFLPAPPMEVAGGTVGEALAAAFALRPALRGYVLDDQGALRRHVAVYVDGESVKDRLRLADPVGERGEIHVFQALTGG